MQITTCNLNPGPLLHSGNAQLTLLLNEPILLSLLCNFQVFECIQSLIKFDSTVEVRRSAAVCATLLLRGLSKDALKV